MIVAIAIIAVIVAFYLYERHKVKPAVVALPGSGLTEDMSTEPSPLDDITLESIGTPPDRGTMGAARGKQGRAHTHFASDDISADTTERFGNGLADRCTRGCGVRTARGANPLINISKGTAPLNGVRVANLGIEPCHYNGFYQYNEPCAMYART